MLQAVEARVVHCIGRMTELREIAALALGDYAKNLLCKDVAGCLSNGPSLPSWPAAVLVLQEELDYSLISEGYLWVLDVDFKMLAEESSSRVNVQRALRDEFGALPAIRVVIMFESDE